MASEQAFPSASNVFSLDDLISKCCETGRSGGEGHCCFVVTKTLGPQDSLIAGT